MIHWWLIANATSQFFLRLFRTSQKYSMHHFHHVWRIFKEISCWVVRVQNSNWKSFQELDIDWVTTVQCQSVIAKTTFIYVKMPQIFTWGFVLCLETTVEGMTNIHKQALLKHLFQSLHILHSLFWRYRNKSKKIGAGFWAELLGGLGIFSWKHPTSWLNKNTLWTLKLCPNSGAGSAVHIPRPNISRFRNGPMLLQQSISHNFGVSSHVPWRAESLRVYIPPQQVIEWVEGVLVSGWSLCNNQVHWLVVIIENSGREFSHEISTWL